jgi:ferric-dicitrate binding protein FerR (iron transport regulator)
MDELICRSLHGDITEQEERALLEWRRAAPQNEAYFRGLNRLLADAEGAVEAAVPPPPTARDLVARAERGTQRGSVRRAAAWAAFGALTAAAVALAALGFAPRGRETALPVLPEPGAAAAFSLGAGEFVTGAGETATVLLADGTVVRLAPESRLRILGVPGSREVFLSGKAFFAVAPSDDIPFRIRTRAEEVVVLGTRFELQSWGADNLRLVVIEGRVAVGPRGQAVEVEAGQMSLISEGTRTPPVPIGDLHSVAPWLDRFIVFQSTPLDEAARELERQYGVEVRVTDRALGAQTVTGWYADRRFEDVLAILCGVLDARCSVEAGVATVSPGTTRGDLPRRPHGETLSTEER